MTVAPNIIHVESPYLIRNLRQRLNTRLNEMVWDFRSIDPIAATVIADLQGRMNGIAEALKILAELEEKDGSARKAKDI